MMLLSFLQLLKLSSIAGFKVADKGCCGTGLLEVSILCNPLGDSCSDASQYVFWDSYHPTEVVYRKLIDQVLQKYLNRLF